VAAGFEIGNWQSPIANVFGDRQSAIANLFGVGGFTCEFALFR
jgi:hypothetical protein